MDKSKSAGNEQFSNITIHQSGIHWAVALALLLITCLIVDSRATIKDINKEVKLTKAYEIQRSIDGAKECPE